ncbi:uncharacterized protein FOMMEDRAFT_141733 [Fomitiporia mediterranea MF3/22]|uniref:uncharacterized protein n=1 Tax=Fomitiporia mediterranea (strain MF3/22) TaxID=694068 RepID=UPI0004409578|nr:uncharacterized protein FOMMEDRAFT_141733 [Fomitiporia mediterranea MF3/22]EJD00984.1 hypothetical protein FOMMEDRAFT_141733 [Fomitiporia mediterranea MF3/22]
MQSDYEFTAKDGGKVWTRRLFGIEQLVGVMASKTPGFGALTGGFVLSLPRPVPAAALRIPLEVAWTRLRSIAPVVGLKTKDAKKDDASNPENSLYFEYAVPDDAESVHAWVKETIKWHDDPMTLRERDIAMKNIWWRAGDGKYNYELHVAPDVEKDKWQIMIHSAHWSADVRGTLQLSELLFTYLNEYLVLHPDQEPSLSVKWGEETKKLTPPVALVAAQVAGMPVSMLFPKPPSGNGSAPETTQPPEADAPNGNVQPPNSDEGEQKLAQKEDEGSAAAPAGPVFFLRPTPLLDETPTFDAVATDVWLTKDQTTQFREKCRRYGITVTQAVTALKAVAEVEWVLTYGEGRTGEKQKRVLETYEKASHLPSLWNVVDQRHKLKEFARYDGAKGSVPFGSEGFPLMLDMTTIRQAVKYNKETDKVERNTSDDVFWDIVAKHCRDLWKSSDCDIPAFLEREMMCNMYSTMYDPSAYMIPALMASSIGDIERLGLLTAFSPSVPSNAQERLLIEQVSISVRCPTPVKMVLSWQWDGRLLVRPQTASRWTSQKGLDRMGEILRSWIEETCLSA